MPEDVFNIVGTTQGGSFRVERAVAEGGFSVIYRAQHGAFRAPVALKCLKVPGDLTASERAAYLEKFREEAELLFRLSASIPEVVRPLHVDTLSLRDGRFVPFLALEWLEGETLEEILERRLRAGQAPMGLFKLVKLLAPVARGLMRAHRFPGPTGTISIVHRDIKPQNLFVANVHGLETVKILDFGIATAMIAAERGAGLSETELTDPVRAFTPRYASPEQWDPEHFGHTGPWTDVWGLAITMVEALAGKPPVDGTQDEMKARVVDRSKRPTPRALGVVIADEIEQAFVRALTVEPQARTPDVEAFWGQLEAALGMNSSFKRRDVRRDTSGQAGGRVERPLSRHDDDVAPEHTRPSRVPPLSTPLGPPSGGAKPQGPAAMKPEAPLPFDLGEIAEPGGAEIGLPPALLAREPSARIASPMPELELELVVSSPSPDDLGLPLRSSTVPPSEQKRPVVSAPPSPSARDGVSIDDDIPDILAVANVRQAPSAVATPIASSPGSVGTPPARVSLTPNEQLEASLPAARTSGAPAPRVDPPASGPLARASHAPGAPERVSLVTDPASFRSGSFSRPSVPGARASSAVPPKPGLPGGAPHPGVGQVLRLPLRMLGLGAVIAVVDVVLAYGGDGAFMLGPVRLIWFGAVLLVSGTALIFWRLLAE